MSPEESAKAVEADERFQRAIEALRQLAPLQAAGQLPTDAEYRAALWGLVWKVFYFYYTQAWQRLNHSFRESLRSLPNTATLEIIGALDDLATLEARAQVAKETGYQMAEMNLGIDSAFVDAATEFRKRKRTREPGRRKHEGYNRAFARIYDTQEYKPVEAFELYLIEEGIQTKDEGERADVWEAFNTAMKRRRRAAK